MGTIRCSTSHAGKVVNGVTLGEPAAPAFYTYDDALLPSGLLLDDGPGPLVVLHDADPAFGGTSSAGGQPGRFGCVGHPRLP